MPNSSARLWLSFATLTFVAYVVLVLTASGDLALRWIVGFVVLGWPTMVVGVTTAIVLTRKGHGDSSSSLRTVVSLSLLAWGAAAIALELSASMEYLPATLFWIAAPTVLSAVSVFATRTPHARAT